MRQCWIGFGGNVGDVPACYRDVLSDLRQHPAFHSLRPSSLYRSVPMGVNAGQTFGNGVICAETTLAPDALLTYLQDLEQKYHRTRFLRWGPRTLDLDVLAYGSDIIQSERLTVPHPGIWYRRFVLDPWCDLEPGWLHPCYQKTLSELRQRLLCEPPQLWLVGDWKSTSVDVVVRTVHACWPTLICEILAPNSLPDHGVIVVRAGESNRLPGDIPHFTVQAFAEDKTAVQQIVDVLTAAYEPPQLWHAT